MLNSNHLIGHDGVDTGVSVILFTTVSGTTSALTIPANIQAGDIAVFVDKTAQASAITPVIPTGFTSIVQSMPSGNFRACFSSFKILTAADASATVQGMTGAVYSKMLMIFRPLGKSVKTVVISDAKEQSGNVDPNPQTLVEGFGLYISFGVLAALTLGTFNTYSPAADAELTVSQLRIGYGLHTYEAKRYTIDSASNSDMALQSFNLNLY